MRVRSTSSNPPRARWTRRANRCDPRRELGPEFDDTPRRLRAGRRRDRSPGDRAAAARHRGRAILGDFKGREGDIVAGSSSRAAVPRHVLVDFGTVEGILPLGRAGAGGEVRPRRAHPLLRRQCQARAQGPADRLSRTHPNLVRKLFALEVPEIADGSVEIAALAVRRGTAPRSPSTPRCRGSTPRVRASGRWVPGCGPSWPSCGGEKIDIVDYSEDPATFIAAALSPPGSTRSTIVDPAARGPGHRPRLPAVAGHRPRGPECPARRQAHRLADRHPSGQPRTGDARTHRGSRCVTAARGPGPLTHGYADRTGLRPGHRAGPNVHRVSWHG
jgi:N utilization substance protein A